MPTTRALIPEDLPALQVGLDNDHFHPGTWSTQDFIYNPEGDERERVVKFCGVIEDSKGPIAFTRFTKTLRISAVWADDQDSKRNARAIIFGIKEAVATARLNGFTEVVIQTSHDKLATFLTQVMKMRQSGSEFFLAV